LLIQTLPAYLAGELQPRPQIDAKATHADRLRKQDGRLDWSRSSTELDRKIRAFSPWPGTYTYWRGQRFRVLAATPFPDWQGTASPATVVDIDGRAAVATVEGALRLDRVQLAGKRAMDMTSFLQGHQEFVGSRLGE
jgi:methionyl-tRNA formyltransferase